MSSINLQWLSNVHVSLTTYLVIYSDSSFVDGTTISVLSLSHSVFNLTAIFQVDLG